MTILAIKIKQTIQTTAEVLFFHYCAMFFINFLPFLIILPQKTKKAYFPVSGCWRWGCVSWTVWWEYNMIKSCRSCLDRRITELRCWSSAKKNYWGAEWGLWRLLHLRLHIKPRIRADSTVEECSWKLAISVSSLWAYWKCTILYCNTTCLLSWKAVCSTSRSSI